MVPKKQNRGFDFRQSLLIVYIGIGVVAVMLTVVIAFSDTPDSTVQPTPTVTRMLSPLILTQQSEGSVNHPHLTATPQAQTPDINAGVETDSQVFFPTATGATAATPTVTAEH